MKKLNFILCILLANFAVYAQNIDFNNMGGDSLWTNKANWNLGTLPVASSIVRLPLRVTSQVDSNFTVARVQNLFSNAVDMAVAADSILTINPAVANGYGIENNSSNNIKMSFRGRVNINNPAGFTLMRTQNGEMSNTVEPSNSIEFAEGSILTLTTALSSNIGSGADRFFYNGRLAGSGNLRFGASTVNTFGKSSNNADFKGEMVFLGGAEVYVNTSDNKIFYNGPKLQINGNSTIELNGANVFASNIVVGGTNAFTVNAKKNQSTMGTISFQVSGTLNINIGDSVTNLTFADNSASAWGTGTLNINKFKNGVVRFGNNDKALTVAQLSQIAVDGVKNKVALNSEGYLVDATLVSVNELRENKTEPVSYPTMVTDKIFFKKLQNDVKILDVNGKVIMHNTNSDQSQISVENLSSGIYFISFGNRSLEKFIKQ